VQLHGEIDLHWVRVLKADSHIACRAHAMPCRCGFRMCPSHLIYTVRPCLIHTCHTMLRPCRSSQGDGTARPLRDCLWAACRRSAYSGYCAEFYEGYQKHTNLRCRWPVKQPHHSLITITQSRTPSITSLS
jgi:hypothetical protein